jgi:hypothetical protein
VYKTWGKRGGERKKGKKEKRNRKHQPTRRFRIEDWQDEQDCQKKLERREEKSVRRSDNTSRLSSYWQVNA